MPPLLCLIRGGRDKRVSMKHASVSSGINHANYRERINYELRPMNSSMPGYRKRYKPPRRKASGRARNSLSALENDNWIVRKWPRGIFSFPLSFSRRLQNKGCVCRANERALAKKYTWFYYFPRTKFPRTIHRRGAARWLKVETELTSPP